MAPIAHIPGNDRDVRICHAATPEHPDRWQDCSEAWRYRKVADGAAANPGPIAKRSLVARLPRLTVLDAYEITLAMVPVAVEKYGARTVWWTVADARYEGGKSDGSSIADPHHGGVGGSIS